MKARMLVSIFVLGAFCFSAGAINQEAANLKNEFQQLRYDVAAERERGADGMEKVFAVLAKFGAKKSNLKNKEEFSEIVAMVGAALPFDMETESAGVIVDFIHDSQNLRSVYDATVATMTDKCRQQLLRTVVNERECMIKLEKSGKRDAPADACVAKPVFLYTSCIGMKTVE
jgi:hypothetical protein